MQHRIASPPHPSPEPRGRVLLLQAALGSSSPCSDMGPFMDFHSTKALPTPPRLWPHSVREQTNLSVRKRLLPWSSSSTTTLPQRPTPSHLNFRVSLQRLTIILHYFYNISRRRTQRRTSHTAPPRMSLRDTTQRWKHFATRCYFGSVKGCRFLALIETCLSLYLFI